MYYDEETCFECGRSWNPKEYIENEFFCPYCGTDSRNPITYYYKKKDRYNIKNDMLGEDWLVNVDIKYFLIEKQKREIILKNTEKTIRQLIDYFEVTESNPEIMKYCEEHYNYYDVLLLDLKYIDVEREVLLKFPYLDDLDNSAVISYILHLAVKSIAQHQLDELYDAMKLREDKGITNEG